MPSSNTPSSITPPTQTPRQALDAWLARTDWTLHTDAINAVETISAFSEGVRAVDKSQLRAVVNTAKVCNNHGTLRRFINHRAERREKANQEDKAAFWRALADRLSHIKDTYVPDAEQAIEQLTATPHDLSEPELMRIVRAYFGHLIAHCHLRASKS